MQESHSTSWSSWEMMSKAWTKDVCCSVLCNMSIIPVNTLLLERTGLGLKVSLHCGQLYIFFSSPVSQNPLIHTMQKLCPHGVVTGSFRRCKQIEQLKCSWSIEILASAILLDLETERDKVEADFLSVLFSQKWLGGDCEVKWKQKYCVHCVYPSWKTLNRCYANANLFVPFVKEKVKFCTK